MPVSIKDIARIAGVSHSTVSRALHNSPLIPAGTAARIQKIAKESGYHASAVARSLVKSKTDAIGVVVTSIADPFNGEVVAGIEEFANRHGYTVLLATSQADPAREVEVVRGFQARRVDGIVVASSRVGALHTALLSELEMPIALLNNQHPKAFVHSVRVDNVDGAFQATQHLIDLGHRKIAYLGDSLGLYSDAERYEGFRNALREAGLKAEKRFVVRGNGKPEGARIAAVQLLAMRDNPTAIVCYNDMSALGVFQEAESRGIHIPHDLSVTGFDDIFFAPYLRPALTTVRQPKRELGYRAAEILLSLIGGNKTKRALILQGEFVIRGSTAPPRMRNHQSILSGKNSDTRSS